MRPAHVEADAALARLLHDAVKDIVHNLGSKRERRASRSRFRSSAAIRRAPLQLLGLEALLNGEVDKIPDDPKSNMLGLEACGRSRGRFPVWIELETNIKP